MASSFTQTAPSKGALATTDGTWIVELREKGPTVGIEVRKATTQEVAGWAPVRREDDTWTLDDFESKLPRTVLTEARRLVATAA